MIEALVCAAILKTDVIDMVRWHSRELGAYPEIVEYIVSNEAAKDKTHFYPCGDGDQHLLDPNGNPHRSRGIAQINVYYHPEVTDEEAYDPHRAIAFIINGLRNGKCSHWTTCRDFKAKNPDHPYFSDTLSE